MAKKKKKRSSSIRFITILFTVVIISYIVRYFWFKIDTEMVKYDTMEEAVATQGVFIKNELTTVLPLGTAADYKVNEGERVATGKEILEITKSSGADENISLKLDKLNERIEEIKANETDNNFFAQDKQKIDANIASDLKELQNVAKSGDFSKLETVKNDLSANVYKKSLVYGTESFSGQNLEQLMNEKSTLEQLLKNNLNVVYAKISGLVSYELDGYEEVLKPEGIKALKLTNIQEIIDLQSSNKKKNEEKREGVKVVDNFEWYVAAVIPKGVLTEDCIGKTIKVRFKDLGNTVVSGTIKHFDIGNEQNSLVVIRTTEQVNGFQSIRVSNIEIITKYGEGLIIPTKTMVERDGLNGIYIVRNGMAKFVPIKVIIKSGQEVMVQNLDKKDKGYNSKNFVLKPYDRVITTVNKVKQDQMLPGAF
ncbi:MAG: HlyD family efflux transporter periplasmic adaptor subunit [Lutisporaceae bacterium]